MGFIKAIVVVGVLALVLTATLIEARPNDALLGGLLSNKGVSSKYQDSIQFIEYLANNF